MSFDKRNSRRLLIFTPNTSNEDYVEQHRLLRNHETGFEERDLTTVLVSETGDDSITPDESAEARGKYGVETGGFAVVLLGKDGTEKFRSSEPMSANELFERIDAMPMRRREMREGGGG